ncbi:MAG: glycosyltransferase family 2 protein [Paracoccaceae bacterium]
MPEVSVVMPVWNAAGFVAEAVASVRAQSFADWELIVVDDGSTDASVAEVERAADGDARIRLLRMPANAGPGPARSRAMAEAAGRFVAFLDCDDLWHPQKLARHIPFMRQNGFGLSYTAYRRIDLASGRSVAIGVPPRVTRAQLLHGNVIGCSTAVYDRERLGPRAMPDLRRRQDYAFWLELLAELPAAGGINQCLTVYRQRAVSVSSSKGAAARDTWALFRNHLGLPFPEAALAFGHYAIRGVLRHRAPGLARALGVLHAAQDP